MNIVFGFINEKNLHDWLSYNDLEDLLEDCLENYNLNFVVIKGMVVNIHTVVDLIKYLNKGEIV